MATSDEFEFGNSLVVTPDGETVDVGDNLAAAREMGARFPTEEEKKKFFAAQKPVQAAGLAAARGATIGLSDVAANKVAEVAGRGDQYSKYAANLKEANPNASLAGEIGGNVASLGLAGPAALVSKGAGAVKAGLAARGVGGLVSSAAAGAAEGTMYGLGQMVSERALGDTSTVSQKLASIAGAGVFGAGLNALTHGVGQGASALARNMGGKAVQEGLDDLANKALLTQIGSKKIMKKRDLFGNRGDEVATYIRDNALATAGDTAESMLTKTVDHTKQVGEEIGALLDDASGAMPAFDGVKFGEKVRGELVSKLKKLPGTKGSVNRIEEDLATLAEPKTLREAWEFQSALRNSVGFGEVPATKKAVDEFSQLLTNEIKDQVSAKVPGFKDAMNEVGNRYSLAVSARELAKESFESGANRGVGLRDQISGIGGFVGASGGLPGLAMGAASTAATRELKDRGGFIAAAALDKLAKSPTVAKVVDGLKAHIDEFAQAGMLGKYASPLMLAGAKGSDELMSTHVQLAKSDPMYLPTLGLESEDGSASNDYADKAGRLDAMAKQLQEHDDAVVGSVNQLLGMGDGYKADKYKALTKGDFDERMKRLNQVLSNPDAVDVSGLASTAPQAALALSAQAQQAAQFLHDKAPKNPYEGMLPAFQRQWEPSKADLEKWGRYVNAIESPLSVLKTLATTSFIPVESAEAIKTVYPQLLADMQSKTMERLAEYKKPLTYDQRRGLATLFGPEFVNQNPKQASLLQAMHAAKVQKTPPPSRDGRQTQSQEDNIDTQAVRIAKR